MAALLPGAEQGVTLTAAGGKLAVAFAGVTFKERKERVEHFFTNVPGPSVVATLNELAPLSKMKQSIVTAFDYIKANKTRLGIERDVDSYDFHVQIVDLMQSKEGSQGGAAFFVALYSLLQEKPVQAGLVALGEMTIQGNILPVRSLLEPLQVVRDNGAKKVLLPVSNRRQLLEVPPDILESVDSIFYSEPLAAALKALGIG